MSHGVTLILRTVHERLWDIMKKKNIINLIKYYAEKNDAGFRNEAYEILYKTGEIKSNN